MEVKRMFHNFGPMEIGIIFVIILIVFGVGKLPTVGGAIGKGIHEFRKATRGDVEEKDNEIELKKDPDEKIPKN
jgi:sec-independent protein translocase protein TatA